MTAHSAMPLWLIRAYLTGHPDREPLVVPGVPTLRSLDETCAAIREVGFEANVLRPGPELTDAEVASFISSLAPSRDVLVLYFPAPLRREEAPRVARAIALHRPPTLRVVIAAPQRLPDVFDEAWLAGTRLRRAGAAIAPDAPDAARARGAHSPDVRADESSHRPSRPTTAR